MYNKGKSDMDDYQLLEHGPQEEHSPNFHTQKKKQFRKSQILEHCLKTDRTINFWNFI